MHKDDHPAFRPVDPVRPAAGYLGGKRAEGSFHSHTC